MSAVHAASTAIQGQSMWQEVVSGIDNIAVQFDPAQLKPNEAIKLFRSQLQGVTHNKPLQISPVTIPVCYDEDFAPDAKWIAEKLGISVTALIKWHSGMRFTVTMLGFMPGFTYLQCSDDITEIGRLPKPRQKVAAGSVGIIGDQSCIYSFSSPGGWPIIGRTPLPLFDPAKDKPALLSTNQSVSFRPIERAEYDAIAREECR
ncbi:allophanate hydrolase subunit 1 [Parasphingorhabdus sp.]|uniref:5-oxoprolinase subunit B family protein n=1 Tax=Parasphingorhabdus sp. TaxID=2709688 RepID=UPI002F94F17C